MQVVIAVGDGEGVEDTARAIVKAISAELIAEDAWAALAIAAAYFAGRCDEEAFPASEAIRCEHEQVLHRGRASGLRCV